MRPNSDERWCAGTLHDRARIAWSRRGEANHSSQQRGRADIEYVLRPLALAAAARMHARFVPQNIADHNTSRAKHRTSQHASYRASQIDAHHTPQASRRAHHMAVDATSRRLSPQHASLCTVLSQSCVTAVQIADLCCWFYTHAHDSRVRKRSAHSNLRAMSAPKRSAHSNLHSESIALPCSSCAREHL